MNTPTLPELTNRARDIFRLVVEAYLADGQPVGSKTLAGEARINLSPASIRSVLADLETHGLLTAPHISAGRIPTDSGLRLFVDAMMQVAQPSADERAAIERRLEQPGPIEQALEKTSTLLSDLSGAAGMVMVPGNEQRLRQFSLVPLDAGPTHSRRTESARALAVLVSEDGRIENRVVALSQPVDASALEQASNYITSRIAGKTLAGAIEEIQSEIGAGQSALDLASQQLVARGLAVWSEDAARRPVLIVRGQANLLDDNTLEDLERVRSLLEDLENKQSVSALMEDARKAEATRIFIGAENRLFALSGSSVIASPYRDRDGKVVGVLGVIGPTRLNYARVVPMIDFTARSLGKLIG